MNYYDEICIFCSCFYISHISLELTRFLLLKMHWKFAAKQPQQTSNNEHERNSDLWINKKEIIWEGRLT